MFVVDEFQGAREGKGAPRQDMHWAIALDDLSHEGSSWTRESSTSSDSSDDIQDNYDSQDSHGFPSRPHPNMQALALTKARSPPAPLLPQPSSVPRSLAGAVEVQHTAAAMAMSVALAAAAEGQVPQALLRLVSPVRALWQVLQPLGSGGFGSVQLVLSHLDKRLLAVKKIPFCSSVPPWAPAHELEAMHGPLLREVRPPGTRSRCPFPYNTARGSDSGSSTERAPLDVDRGLDGGGNAPLLQ
ncbi:hypothetical protein V8C86DRAFT_2457830 [Haematococcus lacustris]